MAVAITLYQRIRQITDINHVLRLEHMMTVVFQRALPPDIVRSVVQSNIHWLRLFLMATSVVELFEFAKVGAIYKKTEYISSLNTSIARFASFNKSIQAAVSVISITSSYVFDAVSRGMVVRFLYKHFRLFSCDRVINIETLPHVTLMLMRTLSQNRGRLATNHVVPLGK